MEKILNAIFLGWNSAAECLWDTWSKASRSPRVVGILGPVAEGLFFRTAHSPRVFSSWKEVKESAAIDLVLDFEGRATVPLKELPPGTILIPKEVTDLMGELCTVAQEGVKYKGVVETARDAVVTIDESHRIVFFNKAAEEMFGYSKEEVMGQDLSIIIPRPHKDRHREYVRRYVETRRGKFIDHTVDLTAERRCGEEFPISISFSVAELGGHLLMTAMMRDMSEVKAMERKLLQNERLASIGRALSFVTHEVKNPLVVIGGFARSLLRESGLSHGQREKLEIIAGEVKRLEGLLEEIQDFSKPLRLNRERLHLGPFLEGEISILRDSEICREVRVDVSVEGDPVVRADREKLRQVLVNLIKNSLEAMEKRGNILVKAAQGSEGHVEITVEDDGKGIPEDKVEDLFQPFFTTKPGGTGLGLPLCRKIVGDHGGDMSMRPRPGGGTIVTIRLPLEEEGEEDPPREVPSR
jgi:two-component system sensor kinase FixL